MLEDLDVAYKGIKVIDEDAVLNALRVNGMLGRFDLRQDNRFDDSPLGRSIRQILLENMKVRDALPYAGPSLELASGLAYPGEVMHAIARELAFLPSGKREEGRATIRDLSAAIQPPANRQ